MLAYVAWGLLAAALAQAVQWARVRVDALGRPRSFPAVGVVACLLLAAGAAYPVLVHRGTERRLGAAASVLVGSPVEVHCQTLGETFTHAGGELGSVRFDAEGRPERRTVLAWESCRRLRRWLRSPGGSAALDQVVAVHVLTHEAMHLAGHRDEAEAECLAVQQDARTARLLGADSAPARTLARRYWALAYPQLPQPYTSPQCRPGGALDRGGPDAPWATPG